MGKIGGKRAPLKAAMPENRRANAARKLRFLPEKEKRLQIETRADADVESNSQNLNQVEAGR